MSNADPNDRPVGDQSEAQEPNSGAANPAPGGPGASGPNPGPGRGSGAGSRAAGSGGSGGIAPPGGQAGAAGGDADSGDEGGIPDDLETLTANTLDQLEAVVAERDTYLDRLQRLQADFENYKKRVARDSQLAVDNATGRMAEALVPVLDSCDAGVAHGSTEVVPVLNALLGALAAQGLERVDPLNEPFDPNLHEAVMFEAADGDEGEHLVVEVMRPGYVWKGQVLRAAMVKVKG